jgi:hypothetical protein
MDCFKKILQLFSKKTASDASISYVISTFEKFLPNFCTHFPFFNAHEIILVVAT